MGDLGNDRSTSKMRLEGSRDDIEGVGMKTYQKKIKFMRRAFREVKVPGPVPCRMILVSGDLHGAGRIASGPTGDVGMLRWSWGLGGTA